jgi:hypothetical protein
MTGNPQDYGVEGVWAFKIKVDALKKFFDSGGRRTNRHDIKVRHAYGSVALWGSVVEHAIGYRAEFARVTSIEDMTASKEDMRWATLAEFRKRYGV